MIIYKRGIGTTLERDKKGFPNANFLYSFTFSQFLSINGGVKGFIARGDGELDESSYSARRYLSESKCHLISDHHSLYRSLFTISIYKG